MKSFMNSVTFQLEVIAFTPWEGDQFIGGLLMHNTAGFEPEILERQHRCARSVVYCEADSWKPNSRAAELGDGY